MFGLRRDHPGELPLSSMLGLSANATELARFWIDGERSHVSIGREANWSPELVGSLVCESLRTAAAAYSANAGLTEGEAFARLLRGFDEERLRLTGTES